MKIYRLEHRSSGLGPFEHRSSRQKHPAQDVLKYLWTDARKVMPDITDDLQVKEIVKLNPKCVFGWETEQQFNTMIKDPDGVRRLGFRLKVYNTKPLHVSKCGQVIFLREQHVQ